MKTAAAALLWLGACATPTPVEQALAQHEEVLQSIRGIEAGLALHCGPPEAEVLVDGVLQGNCQDMEGQVLRLGAGVHRIGVEKPGMAPYQAVIEAGQARTVLRVQLQPSN